MSTFDAFARQLLASSPYPPTLPESGLLYDVCLNFEDGSLSLWQEKNEPTRTLASSYSVIPQVKRSSALARLITKLP